MDPRLEKLNQSLQSAVEGMSPEQWTWHPPGKWCAAEVLEHLYLTYTGTIKEFERVIGGGKPLASPATFAHRVRTFFVVGIGRMPSGLEAPAIVRPKGLSPETVRTEFADNLQAMDSIIAQCEARFGSGVVLLDHPIVGALSAAQCRKLLVVHGSHNLK